MKGLDLSKFKKMSSDKNCTTLQHPDGHTIKIAHSRVHPKMREELHKLPIHKAEGGEVAQDAPASDEADQLKQKGITINVNSAPQPQASQPAPEPVQAEVKQEAAPVAPTPVIQAQPAPAPQQQQAAPPVEQKQTLAPEAPKEPVQSEAPPAQQSAPQPSAADIASPVTPIAAPQPQSEQHPVQSPPDVKQEMSEEDKAWEHDLNNGHITPKSYSDLFAKKSTMGKIGTIFGLLVGGAGAGLTHTENPLMQMMNNEIQNDLEAQKQSKGNAQNYIKLNQMQHMNVAQIKKMVQEGQLTEQQAKVAGAEANMKAYTLANMQMNRVVLHKLNKDLQKLPVGSPERQRGEETLAVMYNAVNNENFNLSDRAASASSYYKMLFGQNNGGGESEEKSFQKKTAGMRMLGPQGEARAKDMEEKHFPGLKGQSSIPLSGGDREALNSGIEFDKKLARFKEWTKKHSGDVNPIDRKEGQALAAELQGAYRAATNGGVYKEGEQNFISKLIDSTPTKFFNEIRVMPQLNAIHSENKARVNQLAKSKGFEGYESDQSSGSSNQAEYKIINGVKYVRGPDGKAVAVGSNDKAVARKNK